MAEIVEVTGNETKVPVVPVAVPLNPVVSEVKPDQSKLRPPVEYKLPNGNVLKMGKPSIPTHLLLPDLAASYNELANGKADPVSLRLNLNFATMIAFVREFNNEPFSVPRTASEVIHIMNRLGEDGCDAVSEVYSEHFSPLTLKSLEAVKK